jgi:hypothetical protein
MRAFLIYIDDWLSSKKIERMDAFEERGYLRLLLRAATEPDCGLPDNDAELAIYSKLGPQWFKTSKEKDFRIAGMTSGQKLRECFLERNGRLYNERLLREWEHQKAVQEKRSQAGAVGNQRRWADRNRIANAIPSAIANGIANESQDVSQNDPNDVCASSFISSKEKNIEQRFEDFDYESRFGELWSAYPSKGRTKIEDSKRMYVERICHDPDAVHKKIMAAVSGKWARSRSWQKGFVPGLSEFLRNSRWLEDPEPAGSTAEGEEKKSSTQYDTEFWKRYESGGKHA